MRTIENAQLLVLLTALCIILMVFARQSAVQNQLIHLTDIFAGGAMAILVPGLYKNENNRNNNNTNSGSGSSSGQR